MARAADYDPFIGPQTAGIDPEPDRSLIRMWGYVTHRPTWQGRTCAVLFQSRRSTVVRPVDAALLTADTEKSEILAHVTDMKPGDVLVVNLATLVAYPDGPGPMIPGLMHAEVLLTGEREAIVRTMSGLEPEVHLKGRILPAEEPAVIGPVPHVVRCGDELRFTLRTSPYHEGNWPPITLPVRYKGHKADHIYSRITDPNRAFVDLIGTLRAQPDGSLRVQAQSVVAPIMVWREEVP